MIRSLIPGEEPEGLQELRREKTEKDTYIYYVDREGNQWYQSESTMKFQKEMAEREKERKRLKRLAEYKRFT